MARFFQYLGILLCVLAFVVLGIFIIGPAVISLDSAPLLRNIMQAAVCKPDETLRAQYSTFTRPGETTTSIAYACMDKADNARRINDQVVGIGGVGFVALWLIGMFMAMTAFGSRESKKAAAVASRPIAAPISTYTTGHRPIIARLLDLKTALMSEQITQAEYESARNEVLSPKHSDNTSLTQFLEELKDARNAGLVPDSHYEMIRKQAIKNV